MDTMTVYPEPVTESQARKLVTEFSRTSLHRIRISLGLEPPDPKRGGTYFYCPELVDADEPKLDKNGRKTRYKVRVTRECSYRNRRLSSYRRHWKRVHSPVIAENRYSSLDRS